MVPNNDFSVNLILHKGFLKFLPDCLNSISNSQDAYQKTVQVNLLFSNYESDLDEVYIQELADKFGNLDLKLFFNKDKLTIAQARNYLASQSDAKWLVFWDVDIRPDPQFFCSLETAIAKVGNSDNIAGIAGGIGTWHNSEWGYFEYLMDMYAYYGKIDSVSIGSIDLGNPAHFKKIVIDRDTGGKYPYISYFQGFNQIVKKEVLEEIGNFDPSFWGAEDRELAARMICSGYRIIFVYDCLVEHYYNFTLGDIAKRKIAHGFYSSKFRRKFKSHAKYPLGINKWIRYFLTLFFPPVTFRKSPKHYVYYQVAFWTYLFGSIKYHFNSLFTSKIVYSDYSFADNEKK